MKGLLAVVIGLVVLAGGYYIFFNSTPEPQASNKEVTGVVTAVDLEQMAVDGPALITIEAEDGSYVIAVPSMGLPLCAAVENITSVGIIAVGDEVSVNGEVDPAGRIVPCESAIHYLEVASLMRDAVFGYEFEYRKGPDGYVAFEDTESQDSDFVTGLVLFNQEEYQELQNSTDAREGPPAIHVRVYENPQNLDAAVWVDRKPRESNIELALGEPEEAVVGGANAARYTADGLYPIDTYVVANGDRMYLLSGMYRDTNEAIYKDFQEIVASFTFIPAPGQE